MAAAHFRTPSSRLAAGWRCIVVALACGVIGVVRAGDLVPIRSPGNVAASATDMPPLVPIVSTPVASREHLRPATGSPLPAPVAIRTLPVAPVVLQPPAPATQLPAG